MRSVFAIAASLAVMSAPAYAAKFTVEFASEAGAISYTFDDEAGTFTASDGTSGTYTFDEATNKLCGTSEAGEVCATFDDVKQEVGFSTNYTASNGSSGTATVKSIEE